MTQLGFAKTSLKIEDLKPRARDLNQEETADMLGGWGWFSKPSFGGWGGQQQAGAAAAAARKRQEEMRQRQQRMALKMSFLNQANYHTRLAGQYRAQANSIRV